MNNPILTKLCLITLLCGFVGETAFSKEATSPTLTTPQEKPIKFDFNNWKHRTLVIKHLSISDFYNLAPHPNWKIGRGKCRSKWTNLTTNECLE